MTTVRDVITQLEEWIDEGVPDDATVFIGGIDEGVLVPLTSVEYDTGTVILR